MDNYGRIANVSSRLREAMHNAGKTQADLVRETGISKGTLSRYLSGKFEPKQIAVNKLAIALNVSEMWLWGCDVPMERPQSPKETQDDNMVTIGSLFENLRKERNLSLAEFSEEIGLSAEEIRKYETGKGGIPSNIVKMLAEYFGISYGQLSAGRVKRKDIFAAFTSTNEAYVEQVTKWVETFGNERFSDEEFGKIIDYAKFILSQRENKN